MSSIQERINGLIIGVASGDKNKGPFQMSLRLLEALTKMNGQYSTGSVLMNYMGWYFNKGSGWDDTGPTAADVFKAVSKKVPTWNEIDSSNNERLCEAAFEISEQICFHGGGGGVNAAHRSMPLALIPFIVEEEISDQRLADMARKESKITHFSPLSVETCAINVILCRRLIQGEPFEKALANAKNLSTDDQTLRKIFGKRATSTQDLNRGGLSTDAFRAALYFVENSKSFDSALLPSLEFAGPANYCPVLVGGIAGALYGEKCIDKSHFSHWNAKDLDLIKVFIDLVTLKNVHQ